MDNDLMARRLRPPSEPPRPSNGHSSANTDEASWATQEKPWATEEQAPSTSQPPWAQDVDVRAGVPWDRPEPEAWPPATDEPESTTSPAAQASVEHSWPPVNEPSAPPQGGSGGAGHTAAASPVDRPSTWDDLPSPWDMPVVHTQPAPIPQATAAPWDTPSTTEPETDEQKALEAAVPGQASWDRPAPTGWDDFVVDDRPAEMLSSYDEEPEAEAAADPEPVPVPEQTSMVSLEGSAPSLADPYDADAPVLSDVTPPAAPTWADWTPTFDPAPEPVEMVQASEPEPAEPVATPPMVDERALSPTPPADLFSDDSGERDQILDAARDQSSAQPVWPEPASAVVPSATEPVVFRIELEIVGDSMRVRPIEAVHRPSPTIVTSPVTPAAATDADQAQVMREDESLTPRHPEFEPRSQLVAEPETASPGAAVPWDDWALPPLGPSAEQPRSPWSDPDPVAAWQLEPTPSTDPLAALPAASFMMPPAPALAAPVAAGPTATAQVARPVSEQPDLWFLAAEPQALQGDDAVDAHKAEEPSSMLTIGLTVLMGIVVVGLIIAFLWLMTSLPILR